MKVAVTILVFCVAALLALGMVMLYSSSMAQFRRALPRQAVGWRCASAWRWRRCRRPGLSPAPQVRLAALPPRPSSSWPWFSFRTSASGETARARWLGFGGRAFSNPRNSAKLALIIALAWYGDRFQRAHARLEARHPHPGLVHRRWSSPSSSKSRMSAPPSSSPPSAASCFLSPESACGISCRPSSSACWPWRFSSTTIRCAPSAFIRWLHLEETKRDKGFQAYQAMVALGNGGIAGKGLGDSRQKLGFLPEHHTDFIFAIIGEELGLVATLPIVLAFIAIVLAGSLSPGTPPTPSACCSARGITFLIGLQAFINIGVVTGALPNKGLPLPFISYGGSNLLMMLLSVGLLLSIARQAREPVPFAENGDDSQATLYRRSQQPIQESNRPIRHRSPRVAIACGGTGGHLFPGLAVAEQLLQRGCAVTLLISPKEVDQQAVKAVAGMEIATLPAVGLTRGRRLAFLRGFARRYRAAKSAFQSLPAPCRAGDGRVHQRPAAPGRQQARRSGRFLHESNTIPGPRQSLAVLGRRPRLRRFSRGRGAAARPQCHRHRHARPRRDSSRATRRRAARRWPGPGSASHAGHGRQPGRQRDQRSGRPLAAGWPNRPPIGNGSIWPGPTIPKSQARPTPPRTCPPSSTPFLPEWNSPSAQPRAVISRAGASSLAELAAMRLPAVLVPYPAATDDHQFHNARAFRGDRRGAACWNRSPQRRKCCPPLSRPWFWTRPFTCKCKRRSPPGIPRTPPRRLPK